MWSLRDVFVVEGDDVTAGREPAQGVQIGVRAEFDVRGDQRGGIVGRAGEHPQRLTERNRRLVRHPGQLTAADHSYPGHPGTRIHKRKPYRVGDRRPHGRPRSAAEFGEQCAGTLVAGGQRFDPDPRRPDARLRVGVRCGWRSTGRASARGGPGVGVRRVSATAIGSPSRASDSPASNTTRMLSPMWIIGSTRCQTLRVASSTRTDGQCVLLGRVQPVGAAVGVDLGQPQHQVVLGRPAR